jgi:hypothetical protein
VAYVRREFPVYRWGVRHPAPISVIVNGGLLLLVVVAILGVEARNRPAASVEAGVRRYAAAVSNGELDAALGEIAPEQRTTWSDFVSNQLGNIYDVRGVAVRSNSLLGPPTDVTTDIDVNRAYPDQYYQASPRTSVEEVDGRWYLAAPLLAPTSELQPNRGAAKAEGGA